MGYTESEIQQLFYQYEPIHKYTDKLTFFDKYFDIVPFTFPEFKTDLEDLFSEENLKLLFNVYKTEQKNPRVFERIFYYKKSQFKFSIKPTNSNNVVLNDYVISKLISKQISFEELILNEIESGEPKRTISALIEEKNQIVNSMEHKLKYEFDGSLKLRFMEVFFKGLCDFTSDVQRPVIEKRRKFLELYLYAQGYLYGQYLKTLKRLYLSGIETKQSVKKQKLEDKLAILNEFDFFKIIIKKNQSLDRHELCKKIYELTSFVTNIEDSYLAEWIYSLIFTKENSSKK